MKLLLEVLVNVRHSGEAQPLDANSLAVEVEKKLAGRGKVLLSNLGIEPLIRVMFEGEDAELVKSLADSLAAEEAQVDRIA